MNKNYCACGCGKEIKSKSTWAKGHNPNKTKDRFDWSNLEKDIMEIKNTVLVAQKYGCSHEAVSYQLIKRGIKPKDYRPEANIDLMHLYKAYKSVSKISKLTGLSTDLIRDRLLKLGHIFSHDNKSLDTEVGKGRFGERISLFLLKGAKDMNRTNVQSPYDLFWKDMRIDVKVSSIRKRPHRKYHYSFSTIKKKCDFYLLIALDDENFPIKLFFVPSHDILTSSVRMPCDFGTKWDKYTMEVNEDELKAAVQYAKSIT